jgi:hypothetical protein
MDGRCQWPSGLRRGSAAVRLLGLQVRIPTAAWMSVSCECSVSSYKGFYGRPIGIITSAVCLNECDFETFNKKVYGHLGLLDHGGGKKSNGRLVFEFRKHHILTWIYLTRGYYISSSLTCKVTNDVTRYVTRPLLCARITCCGERPLLCACIMCCCREL